VVAERRQVGVTATGSINEAPSGSSFTKRIRTFSEMLIDVANGIVLQPPRRPSATQGTDYDVTSAAHI
jgi:hypothetical protein